MNTSTIVQKLWNYCNVLRDDGMSYGDYPGSSPGQADNEAAPAHPCARGIRTSCSAQLTFALTLALSQRERGLNGVMADEPACTCRCAGKPGAGD